MDNLDNTEEKYYIHVRRFFRIWARSFDATDIIVSGVRRKTTEITDVLPGYRILDVATGTGKQAFAYAGMGYDVTGIDLSENMLRVASRKNRYPDAKFVLADAISLPFPDAAFDIVCISYGLHEMPLSIREKTVKELARVTRPSGQVIIVDYALPDSTFGKYFFYCLAKIYESPYYPDFIHSDLSGLLFKAGVRIEKEYPVLFGATRIRKGKKI